MIAPQLSHSEAGVFSRSREIIDRLLTLDTIKTNLAYKKISPVEM